MTPETTLAGDNSMHKRMESEQKSLPKDHSYFEHLRRRLRWQLLVTYLTPLLVLSAFFHYQYTVTLREGVFNHLRSIAENQRNTVDLFLLERVNNLNNAFRSVDISLPSLERRMEGLLAELQLESKAFVDLGLFDPGGKLTAYSGPHTDLIGKDYHSQEWYQRMQRDRPSHVISDVYLGFRGKPHFIIAVHREVQGERWILRASVDPERFADFVGNSYLIKDGEAFVVNKKGLRQTFSGPMVPEPEAIPDVTLAASTEITERDVQGKKYLRALVWLSENEWALVVRVPAAKAYEPLSQARRLLIGIMLLTVLFIVAVVLRRTQTLVDRMEAADRSKENMRLQLFNAAKLASVGEMAAGVAHEINNPLAIVYEEASMMKDILDPQFAQTFVREDFLTRLDAILEATLRGRTITRKLLAFSRKHESDPEPSDLHLLLERCVQGRFMEFKVSNIEVIRDYAEGLPVVMVNRNLMDQVFINLLNNAKDALSAGGQIVLRTRRDGENVRVDLQDNGCGMAPEVLEKIFFPFFTTKGVGKGTGLGLSISYGIIKSMGGRIEVQSEPGSGSVFSIFLPIGREPTRETGEPKPDGSARGEDGR